MKKHNTKVVKILLAVLFLLSFHDFFLQQDISIISQQSDISTQQTTQTTQSLLVEHNLCHSPFLLLTSNFTTDTKLSISVMLVKSFFLKQLQSSDIFTPPKTIS